MTGCVTASAHEGLLWLRIENTARANALSIDVVRALTAEFERAAARSYAAIAITGGGSTFSAGGDRSEMATGGSLHARRFLSELDSLYEIIGSSFTPVIAAINGPAVGGGVTLALRCHLRIAAATASFRTPEAGFGLSPSPQLAVICEGKYRRSIAWRLALGGRITADEAVTVGLADYVVPDQELTGFVTDVAQSLYRGTFPLKYLHLSSARADG